MNTDIRLIITGGTFDKEYDELKGALTFRNSHLPEILAYVRCTRNIHIEINQLKDSLEMDDYDRDKILDACRQSSEKEIVIVHGTDTMTETAARLGRNIENKVIVLTGAMVPYSIRNSDALFNLGAALSAVQLLNPGVYISMNGKIFHWDNVRKNREKGVFEKLR